MANNKQWLDQLWSEVRPSVAVFSGTQVKARPAGTLFQGPGVGRTTSTADAYWDRYLPEAEAAVTAPVAGARPQRSAYLSVARPDTLAGNPFAFDRKRYTEDAFAWMRGQSQYQDWSDDDLRTFLVETANMTDNERAARELWDSARISTDAANREARADRDTMLAELAAFRDGFNEEWITTTLARERGYWDTQIKQTLARVDAEYAARGTTASPYVKGYIAQRMAAQAAEALQVRRFELENARAEKVQFYLQQANQVRANTARTTMDPGAVAGMVQALGAADAATAPAGVSVSGGGTTARAAAPAAAGTPAATRSSSGGGKTYTDMYGNVHRYAA